MSRGEIVLAKLLRALHVQRGHCKQLLTFNTQWPNRTRLKAPVFTTVIIFFVSRAAGAAGSWLARPFHLWGQRKEGKKLALHVLAS